MNALEELSAAVPELQESFTPTFVFGSVTQYVLWMVIIFALVLIVVLGAAKKLTLVPNSKFVNMVEYGYEFVRKDMGENAIGHGYERHLPFLATMFFFILIANFIGLVPGFKTLRAPSASPGLLQPSRSFTSTITASRPAAAGATSSPSLRPACLSSWCRSSGSSSSSR